METVEMHKAVKILNNRQIATINKVNDDCEKEVKNKNEEELLLWYEEQKARFHFAVKHLSDNQIRRIEIERTAILNNKQEKYHYTGESKVKQKKVQNKREKFLQDLMKTLKMSREDAITQYDLIKTKGAKN